MHYFRPESVAAAQTEGAAADCDAGRGTGICILISLLIALFTSKIRLFIVRMMVQSN